MGFTKSEDLSRFGFWSSVLKEEWTTKWWVHLKYEHWHSNSRFCPCQLLNSDLNQRVPDIPEATWQYMDIYIYAILCNINILLCRCLTSPTSGCLWDVSEIQGFCWFIMFHLALFTCGSSAMLRFSSGIESGTVWHHLEDDLRQLVSMSMGQWAKGHQLDTPVEADQFFKLPDPPDPRCFENLIPSQLVQGSQLLELLEGLLEILAIGTHCLSGILFGDSMVDQEPHQGNPCIPKQIKRYQKMVFENGPF